MSYGKKPSSKTRDICCKVGAAVPVATAAAFAVARPRADPTIGSRAMTFIQDDMNAV